MKLTATLIILIFPVLSFGLNHTTQTELFHHMVEVNKNWNQQNSLFYSELSSFNSDVDRIETHLLLVEKNLRDRSTSHLNLDQKTNRLNMLGVLHEYALVKSFPINTGHEARQPYFIDKFGTHCAVGFLVKKSGFGWVSKAISESQNFAYVKEIESPELMKWSVDFGFTLEELAWIQPSYAPLQSYSQLGGGVNGKVTKSVSLGSKWFFSGEFDTLDNLPCLNIGEYQNGQLSCLGAGLDGEINDLDALIGLRVTGHLLDGGVYYPMATFQNNIWSYHSIPNRPNARATAFGASSNIFYTVAIDHPTEPNEQEIWQYMLGNWEQIGKVYGVVHDISGQDRSFAGIFDSTEILVNSTWTTFISKNVMISDLSGNYQSTIGIVPDTVYTISRNQNVYYVGGSATNDSVSTSAIVSSIFNGVAQPLLSTSILYPAPKYAVYEINLLGGNLIISGDFYVNSGFYNSNNIAKLFPSTGTIQSLGWLNETVYTFSLVGSTFFIGGDFSTSYSGGSTGVHIQDVNRLGKLDGFLSIDEASSGISNDVLLAPNPSKGWLEISGINQADLQSITIVDTQGKVVLQSKELKLDGTHLKSGIYIIRVKLSSGRTVQKKWVKE